MQGMSKSEAEQWLNTQLDIALRLAKGEQISPQEKQLVEGDAFAAQIQKRVKKIVDGATLTEATDSAKATYDQAAIDKAITGIRTSGVKALREGMKPEGVMGVVRAFSNSFSDKLNEGFGKWDDNDLFGSLWNLKSAFSFSVLTDAVKEGWNGGFKEGVKQTLIAFGWDKATGVIKSAKSHLYAAIGKGKAMSTQEATQELGRQSGFAAFAQEVLGVEDTSAAHKLANGEAQVFKQKDPILQQLASGAPPQAQGEDVPAKKNAAQFDAAIESIEGLTAEQKAFIKKLPAEMLVKIANLDGEKEKISSKDVMEAFRQHIIPEANGKLVELKPEDLSKLASALSAKQADATKGASLG